MTSHGFSLVKSGKLFVFSAVLFLLSISMVQAATVNIDEFPVFVRPKDGGTDLIPSTSFNYIFDFTTDAACTNVLESIPVTIITDKYGVGFTNLDISGLVGGTVPSYLCEYRDGSLRATHKLNPNVFREESDSGTVAWVNITGIPAGIADGDDDTTYSAGTGLVLGGTTFSLDTTYADNRYVEQNEYPNLDTDSTDDITGVTAGNGLIGGGSSGSVSLDVVAGAGITVNPNNISVDNSLVPFKSEDAVITGAWTFQDDVYISGDLTVVGSLVNLTVTQQITNGSILPSINNTFDLGASTAVWGTVYANTLVGSVAWGQITGLPSNLDLDSTNDLTNTTTFSGDVTGTYNSLSIVPNSIGDNEINYSEITLSDFTNDIGFLTNYTETDPLFLAANNSLARTGSCPNGEFVVNTTTGGVECAAPSFMQDGTGINASASPYLYDDGSTVYLNITALDQVFVNETEVIMSGDNVTFNTINATIINLNGTILSFLGWDTNASDDFSGSWNDLTNIPSGFADGVDNDTTYTNLSEFTNDVGYLTSYTETDPLYTSENSSLARIGSCPAGFVVQNSTTSGVQCVPQTVDTDTTCAADGSCSNITYDSELNFTGWDTNVSDDFSGDFGDLSNIPAGLADGDNDTTYDNGTGLLLTGTTFSLDTNYFNGWDTNASDDFDGSWNSLTDIPAGFSDGVDNDTTYTNLSEFINDVGYLTSFNETDPIFNATTSDWDKNASDDFSGSWNDLTDIPAGFADNIDNDTTYENLSEFNNDVGYLTSFSETDPLFTAANSTLARVGTCTTGQFVVNTTTGGVQCATPDYTIDTQGINATAGLYLYDDGTIAYFNETKLNETITALDTNSVYTNGTGLLLVGNVFSIDGTYFAAWDQNASDDFDGNWSSLVGIPAGFADGVDNNTQLSEAEVDAFADNNNYVDLDINPNTDLDSTDDLTTATAFTGDIAGLYNSLTLQSDVVSDNEIDYSTVTLVDFTNDAGYITGFNETDPFFTAWNYNWDNLTNVPTGFADGVDNDTQYTNSTGLTLTGTTFALDATYFTGWDMNVSDDFDYNWSSLIDVPVGFADGVDNDTQYTNGIGLLLTGTTFSIDSTYFIGWDMNVSDDFDYNWSSLIGVPAGFADGVDNDTQYTAGTGLILSGTEFSANTTYFNANYVEQNEYPDLDINASDDFSGNLSDLNIDSDLNMSGFDIINAQNVSVNECVEGAFGGYVCFNSTHTWIG